VRRRGRIEGRGGRIVRRRGRIGGPEGALAVRGAVAVVAAGVALVPAVPAQGAVPHPRGPIDLGGVPAVALLRAGRVLVLRPNRLEIVLDGRLVRTVAVRQPLDLAQLPSLVGNPAYAARLAMGTGDGTGDRTGGAIRLGAVLAQRPGTAVTAAGLHLRLADTAGAGPARLTGTRARLTLRNARVDADAGMPPSPPAAPGFRYLHGSNLSLEGVTLTGLGIAGAPAVPAVRADGGSALALRQVSLTAGGPGVEVRDPAWLAVEGLDGRRAGGALLSVSGGTGAGIRDVSSSASSGAAVRLRGTAAATIDGIASTGDAAALVVQDVDGVHAGGVRARGDGVVLGGRGIELTDPDVDAPLDGVRVAARAAVVVRGGSLRGRAAAVDADPAARAVLDGVRTTGALRGPVRTTRGAGQAGDAGRRVPWWDRPVRGAGAVALVVLVAGVFLEVLRGRRRGDEGGGAGHPGAGHPGAGHGDGGRDDLPDGALDGDLALDLGERRVH
jgi:hypothetical protein